MQTTRRDFLKITAGTGAAWAAGLQPAFGQRLPMRDVIILLPGIMGSVLTKDGRDVWALSGNAIASNLRTLGGSVSAALSLSGDDPKADDLKDGIKATRLMPDTHVIPGFWKIDGYSRVSNYITTRFDARQGRNFFEFPYDWRRDNRVAARKLARSTKEWLDAWKRTSGNKNARLILIAHSMGGLVSRHFLEMLDGWKDTRMLITFGTPYRGSLKALECLANGVKKTIGPITLFDVSPMVRSFTSVYQLLPIYKCYDPGNGELVRVSGDVDIPNIDPSQAKAAATFHRDIEAAVKKNASNSKYLSKRYALHPIVGNFQPTYQSGRSMGSGVEMLETIGRDATQRGDGTVPQASARPIETPELEERHRSMYVAEVHGSLQNSESILTHLGGILSEEPETDSTFRGPPQPLPPPGPARVAVLVDDLYTNTERITIRARCENPAEPLTAAIESVATGQVSNVPLRPAGALSEGTLELLPEGMYRVRVGGGSQVGSAADVFVVVKP